MKRRTPLGLAPTLAGVLVSGIPASAALYEADWKTRGDGLLTVDTDTGLEWLDVNLSTNRSFVDVSGEFGAGGDFEGFRHATVAEMTAFWENAGIPNTGGPPPTEANFQPVMDLVQLVGATALSELSASTYGFNEDEPIIGERFYSYIRATWGDLGESGMAIPARDERDETSVYAIIGHWLVREAAGEPDTHYVSRSGGHTSPFTNWPSAATNIQAAIDVASSNSTVLVADGVYDTGGVVHESMTNRIVITNGATVRSVNGAGHTRIVGAGPKGNTAVRCAYLTPGASLVGFALEGGHTITTHRPREAYGGGALLDAGGTLEACTISGNVAHFGGGGVFCYRGGLVDRCTVMSNQAQWAGGVMCQMGGTVRNSSLFRNTSSTDAGGVLFLSGGTVENCMLIGNIAGNNGGGVLCSRLSTVRNTIMWDNEATTGQDWYISPSHPTQDVLFAFCCTPTSPGGIGHITNDPQFADLSTPNLRPEATSPCIDAGTSLAWMAGAVDLDGLPRIINGSVDMGACESPSPAITSIMAPTASEGAAITWASFTGAQYTVHGSTNLAHGYDILLQDGIPATPPRNTFTDTAGGVALRGYAVEYTP